LAQSKNYSNGGSMTEKQKRIKKAGDMFISGYNCAQSTAAPFADLVGMDENTMLKASSGFGGGVVKLKDVCGVVSGIALVYGLSQDKDLSDADTKTKFYEDGQKLVSKFTEKNNTNICAELLDNFEKNPPADEPYASKPCLKLVEDGASVLCDYFGIE